MISKQIKNTGAAGGHGMTRIEAALEQRKQDQELVEENSGHMTGCGLCGEHFHLSADRYEAEEILVLARWLSNGGCPYCGGVPSIGRSYWKRPENAAVKNRVVEHSFIVRDKVFIAIRKPHDWQLIKTSRPYESVVKSVDKMLKNYVK